jgi:uncharacterized membrane protein
MFGIPLHLLLVHFPIALALIALVYDFRGAHATGYGLTLWAAAGAALAAATGLVQASGAAATKGAVAHAATGLAGGITLIALAMLRYSAEARRSEEAEDYPKLWLVLEVIGTLAVVLAAITGHRLALGL